MPAGPSWGSSSRPVVVRAVLGKPSPVVFRQAVAGLAADLAERLPRSAFAMVGDDLRADVAAAKRVGLRGILVLSGKTSRPTPSGRSPPPPADPLAGDRAHPTASPRRWPTWSPR